MGRAANPKRATVRVDDSTSCPSGATCDHIVLALAAYLKTKKK